MMGSKHKLLFESIAVGGRCCLIRSSLWSFGVMFEDVLYNAVEGRKVCCLSSLSMRLCQFFANTRNLDLIP